MSRVVNSTLLVVMLALAVGASRASAQDAERLTLDAVIAEAVRVSPDIAAAQRRYDAARQRPAQERSLPDPMVSAGYNSSGNPLPGAGLGKEPTANIGAMVSQSIPYPGKRDLRAAVASWDAAAEAPQIDAARLDVTARVKQAYYRLAYAYAAGDVLTRNRDLLDTLLKVSENRYSVGQAAQQDVIRAQAQLSILELQLERTRQERATREGELNALIARPAGTPVARPIDLGLTEFDVPLPALIQSARESAPMLRRDQIMTERAEIAIQSARKDYKPDFGVSGGYYFMGSMPPMYEVRFDVTVPLQRTRRAAAVAEQQALAAQSRQTLESTRLSLQARLEEDYQMATSARRLATLYRDTVLPQARLALESSMTSYQTGAVDFLSVLTNFGTVFEYELSYFEELASYHTAVSRLEQMSGAPLAH